MNGMNRRGRRERGGEKCPAEATLRNDRIVGTGGDNLGNCSGKLNGSTLRLTVARLSLNSFDTSLQFASVAGRRAVSQGAALAYFITSALSACSAVKTEKKANRKERRERRELEQKFAGLLEGLVK